MTDKTMSAIDLLARADRRICWKCARCGWVDCYTAADLKQYGAPTECQNDCHESIFEVSLIEGLEALADKAAIEVRKATRSLTAAKIEADQLERELTRARASLENGHG